MRLGIGSYTYGWAVGGREGLRGPSTLIDRARSLGVGLVQLCDNLPADTYEPASLERIASAARAAGVRLEVGTRGSTAGPSAPFAGVARRLDSAVLRVVIDDGDDRPGPDEVVGRLKSIASELRTGRGHAGDREPRPVPRQRAAGDGARRGQRAGRNLPRHGRTRSGALKAREVVVDTLGPLRLVPALEGLRGDALSRTFKVSRSRAVRWGGHARRALAAVAAEGVRPRLQRDRRAVGAARSDQRRDDSQGAPTGRSRASRRPDDGSRNESTEQELRRC